MAEELSKLTGESMTTAVTIALRERLARLQEQGLGLADRLLAIGRDCAARASRSRSAPPIMASPFMTSVDYLDDCRYLHANRDSARRAGGGILRACDREQRPPPYVSC